MVGLSVASQKLADDFSPRSGRQNVAHGVSRGSADHPHPPSPLSRRAGEGGERGESAPISQGSRPGLRYFAPPGLRYNAGNPEDLFRESLQQGTSRAPKNLHQPCHSEPFAVIPSGARDLALFAQGRLRARSRKSLVSQARFLASLGMTAIKVFPHPARKRGFFAILIAFAVFPPAYSAASSAHQDAAPPTRGERSFRTLSRAEILQVIRDHLTRQGMPAAANLTTGDLRIQLAVQLPENAGDADVRVKRMVLDPLRRETRFDLWTPQEPGRPPFEVATTWDSSRLETESSRASGEIPTAWRALAQTAPGTIKANVRQKALVRLGHPATLVMIGNNTRITMIVVPLEAGSEGQQIRVRNPANAQVLTAEVVAEGLVRSSF